jgi:hypothetical protein
MESLLKVIEETITSYLKSQVYEKALMLSKVVAIGFILVEFITRQIQTLEERKFSGFNLSDFTKPAFYLFLICFFTPIISLFERLSDEFFSKLQSGQPMYQVLIQATKDQAQAHLNDAKIASILPTPSMLITSFMEALTKGACWLIGVMDIILYSVFMAQRAFLLGLLTLLFPFLLAFSALNKFKDFITKGIKTYLAVWVSIYLIALVINVGQKLFENIKMLLSGSKELISTDFTSKGHLGDFSAVLIAGMIALAIKFKLLKVGMTHLYRIMS